ncbi:MAG TPA: tripartite tricarboxylate transporter permease [Xanthobacteraceae bacterium]|nr:tripartite tricarboxylate transporter permease [Xanthobacteraceae bacterium]
MDIFSNLALGFEQALSLTNIWYCFIGVLLGTLIGVLPGLGPVATIAMLLPITFGLPPVTAMIMLAGIYYGAQYGGSTTAILVNLPGEPGSVVTALDGHQLARKGKAGLALFTAAVGSFFAGTVATFLIAGFAPPLASVALTFGPAEYFALMVLGLAAAVTLAHGSIVKAIAMITLGLLLGTMGQDLYTGAPRFTFGSNEFADGIDFTALAMGIFGIGEIIRNLESTEVREPIRSRIRDLIPTKAEFMQIIMPVLRGTGIGSLLGILPGGGAVLGSFASYSVEKKLSKNPTPFGQGAIEGVAGPESANNAGAQTSFIPMLTLGIPSNPVMALMIGALIIQGIVPGPNVITEKPDLFWGVITSMWVGNAMLLILNLPLIGIWVRLMTVPYKLLFPAIIAVCCIGVYSLSNNPFDVYLMAIFGVVGYFLVKLDCEPAPLLLGFVIGKLLEEYLRRAMLLSRGDPMVFMQRPISATLLVLSVIALLVVLLPAVRKKREEAFRE